jgi:membrane-associated PAP2 superfamily phosphatase
MEFFFKHKQWLWPLLFVAILAPFTPWIDLTVAQYFYDHGNDPNTHFMTSPLIHFMYSKAVLVPTILAILSLPLLFFKNTRKPVQVIVLTLLIGDLLITEGVLKEYWGRPRPKQIEQFGGKQTYRPFWSPNFFRQTEPSKSFVSSHAAVGFLFLAGVILSRKAGSKPLLILSILLTIVFGVGLSLTRMAQGGHFFTDCLFSALIMWWVALMLTWLVYANENTD